MKKYLFMLLAFAFMATSCEEKEIVDPVPAGNVPEEVAGKWMYGTFSMSTFWTYSGQYAGTPFQQAVVFDFKPNGEYEEYVINAVNNYGCRTEAFTYLKGRVTFDVANKSFTLTPSSGKYRGFYSCSPSSNFEREVRPNEMKVQTFYYDFVTSGGQRYMKVFFGQDDEAGSHFKPTTW